MRWLYALITAQCLSGCTLYSSDHQTQFADAEGRVPAQLFSRLGQQSASKPWVLKQLGQPMAVNSLGQGAQVYTWALTRNEISERSFFLLYKSKHTKNQQNFLHLVYSGDELLKHWLDRDAVVDTKALLNSRDLQRLAVSNLEKTASAPSNYSPPERPVVTRITPATDSDE
ncbi:MAG TPA: hypothetical protein PKE57_12065 [Cellvibrionaceae bacterium]|nr:hypothetical protein [Cellvibrionaceae bacterium]HMW48467.1 hypothetical protein [Cellvibrionaceae bacterium]